MYERTYTGQLTDPHPFGIDPLSNSEQLSRQREDEFYRNFEVTEVFRECVNERPQLFKNAVLFFIHVTSELSLRI